MTTFDVRDLVRARVSADRYATRHPDLRDFHARRYAALAAAFGIRPIIADALDTSALTSLEASSIGAILDLRTPFADFMEAPDVIRQLHAESSEQILQGLNLTTRALEDLLVAIAGLLHGVPSGRTVTADDLAAHGLDPTTPWPDEFDYW